MAAAGLDTAAALRERQRLAAREDVEEELFVSFEFRLEAKRASGCCAGVPPAGPSWPGGLAGSAFAAPPPRLSHLASLRCRTRHPATAACPFTPSLPSSFFFFSSSPPDPRAHVQGGAQAAQGAPPRGPQVRAAPCSAHAHTQHGSLLRQVSLPLHQGGIHRTSGPPCRPAPTCSNLLCFLSPLSPPAAARRCWTTLRTRWPTLWARAATAAPPSTPCSSDTRPARSSGPTWRRRRVLGRESREGWICRSWGLGAGRWWSSWAARALGACGAAGQPRPPGRTPFLAAQPFPTARLPLRPTLPRRWPRRARAGAAATPTCRRASRCTSGAPSLTRSARGSRCACVHSPAFLGAFALFLGTLLPPQRLAPPHPLRRRGGPPAHSHPLC